MTARTAIPGTDSALAAAAGGDRTTSSPAPGERLAAIDRGLQSLAGWGRYPVESCRLYEPAGFDDLTALLDSRRELTFVPRGLGRSYGDAALNRGAGVASALHLNRVLGFDAASGVLNCEAGASLDQIIRHVLPQGFFLPVTPGTRHVTLG
ncbi:MAG TPA: FAD-binding protein, partial [Terriglobia bacterium]|nr:FAD-binding protein [Terriglobia bacterium]